MGVLVCLACQHAKYSNHTCCNQWFIATLFGQCTLNPSQVPVLAADKPLYALAKQIQWSWPSTLGEDKYVIMFGGLHVEMATLKVWVLNLH